MEGAEVRQQWGMFHTRILDGSVQQHLKGAALTAVVGRCLSCVHIQVVITDSHNSTGTNGQLNTQGGSVLGMLH